MSRQTSKRNGGESPTELAVELNPTVSRLKFS